MKLTPLMPWQAWVYKKREVHVHKWWDWKHTFQYVMREKLSYRAYRVQDGIDGWAGWFGTRNVAYDPANWGPNRRR